MPSALTQSELFALLSAGDTVVLPQGHAARILRSRFQQQSPTLKSATDPGPILAWPEWTASLWSNLILEGADDRVLLNRAQEDLLWKSVISSRPANPGAPLHPPQPQAQLARSGLRLAAAYNATDRLRTAADSGDTRTFASWVDGFREQCTRHRLLASAFLEQALARHLRGGTLLPHAVLHCVGFERFTPAQRDLISAYKTAGGTVHLYELHHEHSGRSPHLAITADNPREQLHIAVRWIAHQATVAPGTFALVMPRPEEHGPELERHLRETLTPELLSVTADLSSTPWQFAAQPALSSAALVVHALQFLRWALEPLPVERMGQVLLSPYFHFSDSLESRARFETRIRRNLRLLHPELDLIGFNQMVSTSPRRGPAAQFPELMSVQRLIEQRSLLQGTRLHAEWADQVRSLLSALGWPGPRAHTASEFAAFEAWEGALDLLSTLDFTGRRIPFPAFLQELEDEAARSGFAPHAPAAAVQILTLREAEAIPFDHVLILDATDAHLPPPEKVHPLLPRGLQRSLEMPGADPARTCQLARNSLEALMARSGTFHLVAPAHDASGSLRLTRLATELNFERRDASSILAPSSAPVPILLANIPEATPLPPLPSRVVHGGARVLELQSACGFHAFADLRLRAEEPSAPTLGLNPREAGSRLHVALQSLWGELKDQVTLRSLPTADRRAAVRRAVQHALAPLSSSPGSHRAWPRAFLPILEDRYVFLLMQWLEFELKRASFTTLSQEEGQEIQVGPLDLSIRPDRVDQVEGGGLVFIDYKTKYSLSTGDWQGSRPDAPQLPLYTLLANPEEVRGVAFAHLRAGKDMGWISLSDTPGLFPGNADNTQSDLAADIEAWRAELSRLAQAFADGDASVDPKSYPKTCQYCAHRLLCRLNPAELLAEATEEEEDELEEEIHA